MLKNCDSYKTAFFYVSMSFLSKHSRGAKCNGKQNHQCKDCGRQFVLHPSKKVISEKDKKFIDRLLLGKIDAECSRSISLAGIARSVEVSEQWLQGYISELYASQPDDLCASLPTLAEMEACLEDKLDSYIYEIAPLKKTLMRLSQQT